MNIIDAYKKLVEAETILRNAKDDVLFNPASMKNNLRLYLDRVKLLIDEAAGYLLNSGSDNGGESNGKTADNCGNADVGRSLPSGE